MSLSNLFKKASEIFSGSSSQDLRQGPVYQDGETIFCKNNVCVHPASILREDYDVVHHPGYLTIHYTSTKSVPGLHLVWVPNTSLHKSTGVQHSRRSQSLNRYEHTQTPCSSPVRRRHRCLSHTSRDSLESHCSGCSPSLDSVSLGSIDSANETVIFDGTKVKSDIIGREGDALVTSENEHLVKEETYSMNESNNSAKVVDFGCEKLEKAAQPESISDIDNNESITQNSCLSNGAPNYKQQKSSHSDSSNSITKLDLVGLVTEQSTHQKEIHQIKNRSVLRNSENMGNNENTRNSLSTNETTHISSHKETKCQTQETAQSITTEPKSDPSTVENVTKHLVESHVRKSSQTQSINNLQIKSSENVISDETKLDTIAKEKPECNNSPKVIIGENSIRQCDEANGMISQNTPKSHNQETLKNNSESSDTPYIQTNHFENNEDQNNNSDSKNSTNENNNSNVNKNDQVVKSKTVNDDAEEVEVFNIETVRQPNGTRTIPNGTKIIPNGREISAQKPPLWSSSERHSLNYPDVLTQNQSLPCSPFLTRSKKSCRKFSIDLNEMKSLRLFFCDAAKTKGQFVIASRESQYKILHFHHGGLNKLAKLLNEWNFVKSQNNQYGEVLPYSHFMVYQPSVLDSELHPDENTFPEHVDILSFFSPAGQIEDELAFRRYIFFNGVPAKHRSLVWPFLLNYYAYNTTYEEREWIVNSKRQEYRAIWEKRRRLAGKEKEEFERSVESVVEKDVIRTDRGNPFYAGHGNPHVDTMKNILLNYAVYDAGLGYTQGMSDLLAPVLAEIRTEPDVFWCFTGLLRRGLFVCTPTDSDMEQNLNYFRELMRIMEPQFYKHLTKHVDAMELLFCHRWILLCFKREFQTESALSIWESCWSSYATEYFHLFVCLAIISIYGNDVVAQNLRTDEMLLHFSSLANYMDAKLILRKARGLVHNFRQLCVIPCTLVRLCRQCAPGIWDSAPVPTVVCENSSCDCAYRNTE